MFHRWAIKTQLYPVSRAWPDNRIILYPPQHVPTVPNLAALCFMWDKIEMASLMKKRKFDNPKCAHLIAQMEWQSPPSQRAGSPISCGDTWTRPDRAMTRGKLHHGSNRAEWRGNRPRRTCHYKNEFNVIIRVDWIHTSIDAFARRQSQTRHSSK